MKNSNWNLVSCNLLFFILSKKEDCQRSTTRKLLHVLQEHLPGCEECSRLGAYEGISEAEDFGEPGRICVTGWPPSHPPLSNEREWSKNLSPYQLRLLLHIQDPWISLARRSILPFFHLTYFAHVSALCNYHIPEVNIQVRSGLWKYSI